MGKKYPINTWDEPGSDPNNPGNSRFTINGTTITSGPAKDPNHSGKRFVSVGDENDHHTFIVDTESSSGTSFCYIATATLQSNYSESVLSPLKEWRYKVMESSRIGRYFSNNYRNYAPEIAKQISGMPNASEFLRNVFVLPAIKMSNKTGFVSNLILWVIYFAGSITARLIVWVSKFKS